MSLLSALGLLILALLVENAGYILRMSGKTIRNVVLERISFMPERADQTRSGRRRQRLPKQRSTEWLLLAASSITVRAKLRGLYLVTRNIQHRKIIESCCDDITNALKGIGVTSGERISNSSFTDKSATGPSVDTRSPVSGNTGNRDGGGNV